MLRRSLRVAVCAALSAGLVATALGRASASVPGASTKKFCAKALEVAATSATSAPLTPELAEDLQRQYKRLAKLAPKKKLKKATRTIAAYYGNIADGEIVPGDLTDAAQKKYNDATAVFTEFFVLECLAEESSD
jgi:hypothetical protein